MDGLPALLEQEAPRQAEGFEFSVTIRKVQGEPMGLDLDLLDGVVALVNTVKPGTVQVWNERNADQQILPMDRIIEVNGIRGNTKRLFEQLRQDSVLTVVLRRQSEFRVVILRARGVLGLDLAYAVNGTSLLITQVHAGIIREWNAGGHGREVSKLDRIVEVSGTRGCPAKLLQRAQEVIELSETLDLAILPYRYKGPRQHNNATV